MFVHRFSEGGWWGESEKISTRSGVFFCFCFVQMSWSVSLCISPLLIKLVMAFILHVIISRIYGIEGWFLMFELPI